MEHVKITKSSRQATWEARAGAERPSEAEVWPVGNFRKVTLPSIAVVSGDVAFIWLTTI